MTLDVFLQELSYEEITQQRAYDVAMLLSMYIIMHKYSSILLKLSNNVI